MYDDRPTKGMFRAGVGGDIVNLLIRASAAPELTEVDELVPGMLFTHLGEATFVLPSRSTPGNVAIPYVDGRVLKALVRADCMLTQTAWSNMSGTQEGELVVGIYKGGDQFELIACGYMNIVAELAGHEADSVRKMLERWGEDYESRPHVDLSGLVKLSFNEMAEALQFRRGARLLNAIGAARESSLQDLYYMLAPFVFAAYGVKLLREVGTGFGVVDFQVSRADETHLIEFKQWKIGADTSKLLHGLTVQLPSYIEDMRARRGWLAVFVMGDTEEVQPIHDLHDLLVEHTDDGFVNVVTVDARYQHPASKRSRAPKRSERSRTIGGDPFTRWS
jgi:hypothetical protein